MRLVINGNATEVDEVDTVSKAVRALGHDAHAVAVAVNREFVPRSQYDSTPLREDDELEIVSPRQGG